MCPAPERDHAMATGGPVGSGAGTCRVRPGGGTYPVRPAASVARQATDVARESPARKPPRGFVPYARDSGPRVFVATILIALWVLTFVLVGLSVRSYLPEVDWASEPVSPPAADAVPE